MILRLLIIIAIIIIVYKVIKNPFDDFYFSDKDK